MSPCSSYVLHGSYDTGTHPSVGLFQLAVNFFFLVIHSPPINSFTYQGELGVAEIHAGTRAVSPGSVDCGFGNPVHGLVMDGWKLPLQE